MRATDIVVLALFLSAAIAQMGAGDILSLEQERPTLIGSIAKDWQLYTVMVLLLMVGIVALAYVVANAFSFPDLKAWADVELGEIFASALVLILIVGIVGFIDLTAAGILGPSFPGSCEKPGFCPANIAYDYLDSYIASAAKAYRTTMINSIDTANDAMAGSTVGIQDLIYGYLTYRFRDQPQEMIRVEMYDQVLQNLGAVFGALNTQRFMVRFMTFGVAPIAIFTGIVLRSFFLTRKMGGLLLAFGLGFLIVFPLTYALAWYTLDAAIYGAQKGPSGKVMPCPEVCIPFNKIVDYSKPTLEEVPPDDVREDFYEGCLAELEEDGIDDTGRSNACMQDCRDTVDETGRLVECMEECRDGVDEAGRSVECMDPCVIYYRSECFRECEGECVSRGLSPPPEMGGDPEEIAAWEECIGPCVEASHCQESELSAREYCRENVCGVLPGYEGDETAYCRESSCGVVAENETAYCQERCVPIEGFGGSREEYCASEAEGKMALLGKEDRVYVGEGADYHSYGYCPLDLCGYPIPMQRKECVRYLEQPNICNTRPFEPEDPAYAMLDESEIYGCPEQCITLAPMKNCQAQNSKWDAEDERWVAKCPSQCMWMTTGGVTDDTCPEECAQFYPADPEALWEGKQADQTCVYIIPDVVFNNPDECTECAFVAEKGLAMEPKMIVDCTALCGAPSSTVMTQDPASMTNSIGGMKGPTDVIAVSKLMVPAYVLPFFCLAITLMFIMTLSPMLGGDIDIPGMMRMIQ